MINNEIGHSTTELQFINSQTVVSDFTINSEYFPNYSSDSILSKDSPEHSYDPEIFENLEEANGNKSFDCDNKTLSDIKSDANHDYELIIASDKLINESKNLTNCDANINANITSDANSSDLLKASSCDTHQDSRYIDGFDFVSEINLDSIEIKNDVIEKDLSITDPEEQLLNVNADSQTKFDDEFLIFDESNEISEGDIIQCSLKDYLPTFEGAQKCAIIAPSTTKCPDKLKHNEVTSSAKETLDDGVHKSEKNMRVLSELASGSLATCSSILDVGIDENVNRPGLRANAKIRSFISNDRIRRSMIDADLPRRSIFNGSESVDGKVHRNRFLTETECTVSRPGLVRDRLGFFERAANAGRNSFAVRKSVSELKSRSLDPPPESSTESINIQERSKQLPTSIRKPPTSIRKKKKVPTATLR